ncbi:photosynthetic reaction center subunit M [Candidatus Chloroploca asiatica]|uniref:Reaction center protein M chain n=3 Tax=Candidatus Chloroploca asiatica TaxID=1506545 RepID=A0A2H3KPA2_9CHLR|nr:photosynthetic reaction center subunit M [Candidatus Chloroploca asiatica]PDV96966.1 photosynthetic reaction center subunit M [Candidatus Chloroploca asiatica]
MATMNRTPGDLDLGPNPQGRIGKAIEIPVLENFGLDSQIGPTFLGLWNVAAYVTGGIFTFIWLAVMAIQVNWNPVAFAKYFFVLQIDPPASFYGLSFPPLNQGGWWLISTFFLTISIFCWYMHLYTRARTLGIKPYLAYGFTGAIVLYLVIYLIRPMWMADWSEAPSHGLKALLDWTNNVSVRYGNFYYNPFHMLSIFFLLGSTVLLAMHAGTIWALEKYAAHEEWDELQAPGTGTERAQLFWRWCMGFNANAYSIHLWAFWFAWLCGVTGAIGVFLSMPDFVNNWFQWGIEAGIAYPQFPQPSQ